MDYKFIADLLADVTVPTEGIISRVLQKDEHVNITLFGSDGEFPRIPQDTPVTTTPSVSGCSDNQPQISGYLYL